MNGRTNGRMDVTRQQFFEEQLFEAKQALFAARSVREMKFIQEKIAYLKKRMKETK